jgi:hypothetical protein
VKAADKTTERKVYKDTPGGHEINCMDNKLAKNRAR